MLDRGKERKTFYTFYAGGRSPVIFLLCIVLSQIYRNFGDMAFYSSTLLYTFIVDIQLSCIFYRIELESFVCSSSEETQGASCLAGQSQRSYLK